MSFFKGRWWNPNIEQYTCRVLARVEIPFFISCNASTFKILHWKWNRWSGGAIHDTFGLNLTASIGGEVYTKWMSAPSQDTTIGGQLCNWLVSSFSKCLKPAQQPKIVISNRFSDHTGHDFMFLFLSYICILNIWKNYNIHYRLHTDWTRQLSDDLFLE